MKNLLWLISIMLIIVACDDRPEKVISDDAMVDLLVDIHRGDAYLSIGSPHFVTDSSKKVLRQSILKKHGVTQEEFDSSLNWYGKNIDRFVELYAEVEKQLDNQMKQARLRAAETGEIASGSLGDEHNLWYKSPIKKIAYTDDSHLLWFELDAKDASIVPGDRFNWQFRKLNSQSEMQMFIAVDYEDGTTSYASRSFLQNTPNCKMTLQTDSVLKANRVYGYARYFPAKDEVIFIDSIIIDKKPLLGSNYSQIFSQRTFNPKQKLEEMRQTQNDTVENEVIIPEPKEISEPTSPFGENHLQMKAKSLSVKN